MWTLRQSIEGDKFITVNDVSNDIGDCWIDNNGFYLPNSIAIKIDNIEYLLPIVEDLQLGFLTIRVPQTVFIKANTSIQVYAKCSSNPDFKTYIQYAKPINFNINTSGVTVCNEQLALTTTFNEWVRLFIPATAGDYFYFGLFYQTGYVDADMFNYQPYNTGNITLSSISGSPYKSFQRLTPYSESSFLFSNVSFDSSQTLFMTVAPNSLSYFTFRIGYIELIFNGGTVNYINYLANNFNQIYLANYIIGDQFIIIVNPEKYSVFKNAMGQAAALTIDKTVTYNVNGGNINPVVANVGQTVTWNIPVVAGDYTVTSNLGEAAKFSKTIKVHSCGSAVNDNFQGAYNTIFNGNVSLNDKLCDGENTYVELTGSTVGAQQVNLLPNGEFTLLPNTNFQGDATFNYSRFCGSEDNGYENVGSALVKVNFVNSCTNINPTWVDTGNVRCINCIAQKEQEDINSECSGTIDNQWVPIGDQSICSDRLDWVDTNETKCEYSHKFLRQINLNRCDQINKERWIDLGVNSECDCLGEIFFSTDCESKEYYVSTRLLNNLEEKDRTITKCLIPDLGECVLYNKSIKFYTLNDNLSHDYVITIFDCNYKVVSQIILTSLNCTNESFVSSGNFFNYTFNFSF